MTNVNGIIFTLTRSSPHPTSAHHQYQLTPQPTILHTYNGLNSKTPPKTPHDQPPNHQNAPRPPPPPTHHTLHASVPNPRNPHNPPPRLEEPPHRQPTPGPNHHNLHAEPSLHNRATRPPTIEHPPTNKTQHALAPAPARTNPAPANLARGPARRRIPPNPARRADHVPRAGADGRVHGSGSAAAGPDAAVSYPAAGE